MEFDYTEISAGIRSGAYRYLGRGSGRRVYDLGNGFVVKSASAGKGIAQNQTEYFIWETSRSPILAMVADVSPDFRYLIMQRAEKIYSFAYIRSKFHVQTNQALFELAEIKRIVRLFDLLPADLIRATSWGKIDGKPVIIDYGFTRQVRKALY